MSEKAESLDIERGTGGKTPGHSVEARPLYYPGELARAYVPSQTYGERLNPEEGLKRGTIFPELYSPY